MRKASAVLFLGLALALTGCIYMPGQTNLRDVAKRSGLRNVTTGDGTFENYVAMGHYTGTEWGLAVGIPLICKFAEIVPINSNEDLLTDVANDAKRGGATSMINVKPHWELYTGIPFWFVGIYVDKAEGTGIAELPAQKR